MDPITCTANGCYYSKPCSNVNSPIITSTLYDSEHEYPLVLSNNDMLVNGSDIGLQDSQCFLPIFANSESENWIIGNGFMDHTYTVFDLSSTLLLGLGKLDEYNTGLAPSFSYV